MGLAPHRLEPSPEAADLLGKLRDRVVELVDVLRELLNHAGRGIRIGDESLNQALADTGLTRAALDALDATGLGIDRLAVLLPGAVVASNTIGNVPAVMVLLAAEPVWPPAVLQALALTTTLAGNFFLVGSIANLIVAERAAREGVRFGFADHARAGVPMTLASLAVAALWLWGLGRIGW